MMAIGVHNSGNRRCFTTRSRLLLTLLFFNSFLGCIYYIREQAVPITMPSNTTNSAWNQLYDSHLSELYGSKATKALRSIRDILANEYNQADLIGFYQLVQREYYMGLKCQRNANVSRTHVVPQRTESPNALKSPSILKKLTRYLFSSPS
jgi:hypothetical protein